MSANSKPISEPGEYDVMIIDPYWEQAPEKNGDKTRMCLVLPCHTDDGLFANFRAYFTSTIFQKGKNAGKSQATVNAELCIQLGMTAPFDPARIDELTNKLAFLVMELQEYQGRERLEAKYLNPKRREKLSADQATEIWAKLTNSPTPAAKAASAKAAADDDLPF